jgi:ribonuclease P/MRP protein subunit POP1
MDGKGSLPPGKGLEARKRKEPPIMIKENRAQTKGARPTTAPTTSRGAKRVKFQDARNIRTQPSDAALDDGKLDLQKFLNTREFEIKALENSMRKCKTANATRVFQQVPRAMRRRTASHNVKRVPKRLRDRARKEMIEDNTPTVESRKRRPRTTRARIRAETAKTLGILAARKKKKQLEKAASQETSTPKGDAKPTVHTRAPRPKIRRNMLNDPPKAESKFRKRQINKTWLPTHLWHAKRATMTEPSKPLWRFAVPLTPTEKCYRPTHRASGQKGVVAWDLSYMSTIGLYGTAEGAERVLRALGLTQEGLWGARGQKWRAGVRKWSGLLSKRVEDSRRDIGPATIVWNPQAPAQSDQCTDSTRPTKPQRQLFIRTHPSCFLELFQELLKLAKMQTPQLHVEDLRFEIGSIELTGPGSTETLLGALQPFHDKPGTEEPHGQVFQSLAGVANPASLPKDALLAFSVQDPRLAYPPTRVNIPSGSADATLIETLTTWPVEEGLQPFALFNRDSRFEASKLPSQKAINRRKGSNAPGEPLKVTGADPAIPIMLFVSRPSTDGQAQGTWTLLAPWKCIMPIWYTLMHYPLSTGGNPRLGGLNEQRQIAFEHGTPWFPGDFPATDAGLNWELEQRAKRKKDWDRRPKGKRVEWKSLDLGGGRKGESGDGLACDFEHLFALPADRLSNPQEINSGISATTEMDLDPPEPSDTAGPCPPALGLIRQLTKTSFTSLLGPSNSDEPPANSIIAVNLTFVTRGVANSCARIYRLPTQKPRIVQPAAVEAEVLATDPASTNSGSLPCDLRDQWLREQPWRSANPTGKGRGRSRLAAAPQMPPGVVDMDTRKKLLTQSLISMELPYPRPAANQLDIGGHPLCPNEEDLLGFVTTGAFSLSEGKGTAIGSISAAKALATLREAGAKEGKLCVVRNAGESVGWLARWDLV